MKEQLQKRLQILEAQMQQTLANYNALIGAKGELTNTIALLDQAENAKVEDTGAVVTQDVVAEVAA